MKNKLLYNFDNDNLDVFSDFTCEKDVVSTNTHKDFLMKRKIDKQTYIFRDKTEKCKSLLKELPKENEILHIVTYGNYDYFSYLPTIIDLIGTIDIFYGSTWTMNNVNVQELFKLYDSGKIKEIAILSGLYFKSRETAVYAKLLQGLLERNQKFICFENHTKVMLIGNYEQNLYIVLEGSANFTANPRLEQNIILNNKETFDFHKKWMEYYLNG